MYYNILFFCSIFLVSFSTTILNKITTHCVHGGIKFWRIHLVKKCETSFNFHFDIQVRSNYTEHVQSSNQIEKHARTSNENYISLFHLLICFEVNLDLDWKKKWITWLQRRVSGKHAISNLRVPCNKSDVVTLMDGSWATTFSGKYSWKHFANNIYLDTEHVACLHDKRVISTFYKALWNGLGGVYT